MLGTGWGYGYGQSDIDICFFLLGSGVFCRRRWVYGGRIIILEWFFGGEEGRGTENLDFLLCGYSILQIQFQVLIAIRYSFMLLYFYAFIFLYSCIFMLLYFYALVPCLFVSPCFFVPMFFASISTPQKINMLLLPYAFVSDYFSPLAHLRLYDFVLLYFCLPIPLSAYVFYLYDFISFCLYAFIILRLVYYVFRPFVLYSILRHRLHSFIT